MTPPPVACAQFVAALPTGERRRVTLEVGRPYRRVTAHGEEEWGCAVAVRGLSGPVPDAVGQDSLQALGLAVSRALAILRRHEAEGVRLLALTDALPVRPDDYLDFEGWEAA